MKGANLVLLLLLLLFGISVFGEWGWKIYSNYFINENRFRGLYCELQSIIRKYSLLNMIVVCNFCEVVTDTIMHVPQFVFSRARARVCACVYGGRKGPISE
jgi:hypothetical protein